MEIGYIHVILSAFITIVSLGLLFVSFASYRKYKNNKLLFVSLVFVVFLVKGILLSIGALTNAITNTVLWSYSGVFDVLILACLFIATLKR